MDTIGAKSVNITTSSLIKTGSQVIMLPIHMEFNTGLYITVGGTADITVLYR